MAAECGGIVAALSNCGRMRLGGAVQTGCGGNFKFEEVKMEPEKSLDTTAAKAYEKFILPAFMLPAAKEAIELAVPQAGDKVLDVACGTGLVARLIAPRVTPGGVIRCLDFRSRNDCCRERVSGVSAWG